MSDILNAEIMDQEIEVLSDQDTESKSVVITGTSKDDISALVELADNSEKLVNAMNKIRLAIFKLAQPSDWVLFGEKAEIGFAGANRIATTFGVDYSDFKEKKITGTDEKGDWYRYEFECTVSCKGRTVISYGRAGSRDKFFGKEKGELKKLHDVDEGNVKIAARRSAMKDGVKTMFGLHHMDADYLRENGIKLSSAGGYDFKKSESTQTSTTSDSKFGRPGYISFAQSKRLFALLKVGNKNENDLKTYIKEMHKCEATHDIKMGAMYDDICAWAQAQDGTF